MNMFGEFDAGMNTCSASSAAHRTSAPSCVPGANGPQHNHALSNSNGEAIEAGSGVPSELFEKDKLLDKLTMLLKHQNPPVTDLQSAFQGFQNLRQFVAAVDVSHNLAIPFGQLKSQMQIDRRLGKATHILEGVDVKGDAKVELENVPKQTTWKNDKCDSSEEARTNTTNSSAVTFATRSQY